MYQSQNTQSSSSHMAPWVDVSVSELYVFLAMTILMPQVKKHKIGEYWSTDPLIETPIFATIFARDRYDSLLRYLHFADNKKISSSDRLSKFGSVLDDLRKKFCDTMYPYQNLVVDESLMLWKGRLDLKQHVPSKRSRFGIKLYMLCDCRTGFILDFLVYTGSSTSVVRDNTLGVSGAIVMKMIEKYLYRGHNLYVDNWYSSPALFEILHQKKTGACGTVGVNRRGLPNLQAFHLNANEQVFFDTDIILALKWKDKRDVHMISTIHGTEVTANKKTHYQTGRRISKPISVQDYNENRGLVDKSDMQISFSESLRKSLKWYKKLFLHLFDISLYNACVLYKLQTGENIALSDFRLNVVRALIEEFGAQKLDSRDRPSIETPVRITARHFPSKVESSSDGRRRCFVCSHTTRGPKQETKTSYECKECNVGLCVVPCFEAYHTLKHF